MLEPTNETERINNKGESIFVIKPSSERLEPLLAGNEQTYTITSNYKDTGPECDGCSGG